MSPKNTRKLQRKRVFPINFRIVFGGASALPAVALEILDWLARIDFIATKVPIFSTVVAHAGRPPQWLLFIMAIIGTGVFIWGMVAQGKDSVTIQTKASSIIGALVIGGMISAIYPPCSISGNTFKNIRIENAEVGVQIGSGACDNNFSGFSFSHVKNGLVMKQENNGP